MPVSRSIGHSIYTAIVWVLSNEAAFPYAIAWINITILQECVVSADPLLTIAAPAPSAQAPSDRWFGIDTGGEPFGLFCGCLLAISASVSFAWSRVGILSGMLPADLTLLRFGVAGLILLPVLLRFGILSLAGIGWPRGLALLVTGGPLFILPQAAGYIYAPLAHGGVIAPSTVTIFSTIMAAAFLGERLSRAHVVGACMVIAGIVLISWHGLYATPGSRTWIGDLLFVGSSTLWAGFTVLVRLWRLEALRAIAVVSVLSAPLMALGYLAFVGLPHLRGLPTGSLIVQGLLQGGLQGVVGIVGYSHAIRVLGVSRAVLFPASVPAVSILIGIPILGEIPTIEQITGVVLVTAGLVYAVGAFNRRQRSKGESIDLFPRS
jgi:drug/metabolite transporter (DMT)-like permease